MPILNLTNNQTKGESLTVSRGAKKIFQALYWQSRGAKVDEDAAKIRVSDVVSRLSFFYEKIRNAVDYREEYLLRKEAITRILKRLLIIEGVLTGRKYAEPQKIARSLLEELIRAGYLPNNKLPESAIDEAAVVIHKFLSLRDLAQDRVGGSGRFVVADLTKGENGLDDKNELNAWIIGLCAAELEENLSQNKATEIIVEVMYEILNKTVKLPPEIPYERDLAIQLYLGIYRNYLKLDDYNVLSFVLFKYFNEDWQSPTTATLDRIADRLDELKGAIDRQLDHPLKSQLNRIVHQQTVYFTILKEVAERDPQRAYETLENDPKSFMRQIKESVGKHYNRAKSKLWKSAFRSIIYIFLTKSIFVVLLEVPANRFFNEPINTVTLGINILFPALLLFLSVALMKLPGENNTAKIVAGVEEALFEEKARKQPITLRVPHGRGQITTAIFNVVYGAMFLLSFGLVVYILDNADFTWVSIIIFLFFLVFVSFFVIRIRRGPRYWVVVEPKENLITLLWSFVSVPVVSTGKWLSGKVSKINFLVFILDFIIEAPFKVVVKVIEEWTSYLKERRDSIN